MADPGDVDLVQAVARREPDALVTLYERHGRVAFALAYRVVDDAASAEEVVQDAFLRVWHHAASFDPARGGVRAWLLTIVHHRAIDARRGRGGRRDERFEPESVEAARTAPDLWGEVERGLERERVRVAVDALPDEQRQAIELAYYEGLTHGEIAARTGAPLGTVKGRLRLGLRKLHGLLAATGAQHEEAANQGAGQPCGGAASSVDAPPR